jgi:hypothetical protein
MTLFIVGSLMLAAGIGIILALRSPQDAQIDRAHVMSMQEVLLSNALLALIIAGGGLMALAIF